MRLTEFLSQEAIKVPLEGRSKEEVLRELVTVACRGAEPALQEYIQVTVLERERLMSTGIGHGIALPHGISTSAISFTAALGITARPIEFDAIDGEPVSLIFLLISDEEHINTKMRALARVSRLLHRDQFRTALERASSPAEAMQIITDEEARRSI